VRRGNFCRASSEAAFFSLTFNSFNNANRHDADLGIRVKRRVQSFLSAKDSHVIVFQPGRLSDSSRVVAQRRPPEDQNKSFAPCKGARKRSRNDGSTFLHPHTTSYSQTKERFHLSKLMRRGGSISEGTILFEISFWHPYRCEGLFWSSGGLRCATTTGLLSDSLPG